MKTIRRAGAVLASAGLMCFLATSQAIAAPNYFTIAGDEKNPNVDTVQFDPAPISTSGSKKMFNMRANRAVARTSQIGVLFRSYAGVVEFDCDVKTARFVRSYFYLTPLWQGEPYKTTDYGPDEIRPMRLMDFKPNPTERIVKAACP